MNNRKQYRSIADVNGPLLACITLTVLSYYYNRELAELAFLGFTIPCLTVWGISLIVKQFGIKSLWVVAGFGLVLLMMGSL